MNFLELASELPELAERVQEAVIKAESEHGPGTGAEKKKAALNEVLTAATERPANLDILGQLVEALLSGDEEAQKSLLSQALPMLYNLITFITGKPPGLVDMALQKALPALPYIVDEVADQLFGNKQSEDQSGAAI